MELGGVWDFWGRRLREERLAAGSFPARLLTFPGRQAGAEATFI